MPEIPSASTTKLVLPGAINLKLLMCSARSSVMPGVVNRLAVSLSSGTTSINKFKKAFYRAERKIVPHHYPLVPILIVHEAKSEDEKNTWDVRQFIGQDPAQLATLIKGEPRNITCAPQVVLKAVYDSPFLFFKQMAGLIEVAVHPNMAKI